MANPVNTILKILEEKGITFEELSALLLEKGTKISARTLRKKFSEQKVSFVLIEEIIRLLGYQMIFTKRN